MENLLFLGVPILKHFRVTTKKQMTEFSSTDFEKNLSPSYIILRIDKHRLNSVNLDDVAHIELPQQDLRCLQIQYLHLWCLKC